MFVRVTLFLFIYLLFSTMAVAQTNEQKFGTGLVPLPAEEYKALPLALTPMSGELPVKVSLKKWLPPIGNQGQQGSCVGWATGYYLKSYHENKERGSSDFTYSPSYIYNQIRLDKTTCRNGSYIRDALNLINAQGDASLSDFGYNQLSCNILPTNEDKKSAAHARISSWNTIDPKNLISLKAHLAQGKPLVIGMAVDNQFQSYRGGVFNTLNLGIGQGGHAMLAVGYDDSKSAFLVVNSWGENWGENGFGWISYAYWQKHVSEVYSTQDIINEPEEGEKRTFAPAQNWIKYYGSGGSAGGWTGAHPRHVIDVNGDDLPDIVGFASTGAMVALNTGDNSFAPAQNWIEYYGSGKGHGSWSPAHHPRIIEDVNGDDLPDIVGFASTGAMVALNTGSGGFSQPRNWIKYFGSGASIGRWSVAYHPRYVKDLNKDGYSDIIGFASTGALVALNQ